MGEVIQFPKAKKYEFTQSQVVYFLTPEGLMILTEEGDIEKV